MQITLLIKLWMALKKIQEKSNRLMTKLLLHLCI